MMWLWLAPLAFALGVIVGRFSVRRYRHDRIGRGRDTGYPMPPAQIRTCRITAYGSCLGL